MSAFKFVITVVFVVVNVFAPRTMFPPIVRPVSVPNDVIFVCAAPVTVAAVPLTLPVTFPVNAPANPVEVNIPVEGINDSFVDVVFCGRLPVFAVTHVGYTAEAVATSSVIAVLVALVAVVAVLAVSVSETIASVIELLGRDNVPAVRVNPFDAVNNPAEVIVPVPVDEILLDVEIVFAVAIVPKPEAIEPEVRIPTPVSDEPVTPEARVVPVRVPAAAVIVLVVP